jgi:diguanylate cyclase (GGDEF)-like protein
MIETQKIWTSTQLPTLPSVAIRLLDLSKDSDTGVKEVIAVIKTDPAISAKIVKAANSSFFGFKSQVTSIDRAVPLLGMTVVTSLALSFSLVDGAMTEGPIAKHFNSYWVQSVAQAVANELLGKECGGGLECEYFLAGLLTDVGRLAMLKTIPNEYLQVVEAAVDTECPVYDTDTETESLGINHIEIGHQLMDQWNFPESLIDSLRFHHASRSHILEMTYVPHFDLIKSTAIAAATGEYFAGNNMVRALERIRELSSEFFGFSEADLEDFLTRARARTEDAGELLSIDTCLLGQANELMVQANEQLAELALQEHASSTKIVARSLSLEREKQDLEFRNRKLQQRVTRDPLTNVHNRRFFDEFLQNETNRCSRQAAPVGLLFIDVDNFKRVNDKYGHQFGDQVLQSVAAVFPRAVRQNDVTARFGGEEFIVLATDVTPETLSAMAERVRASVESETITYEQQPIGVTVSIGGAVATPDINDAGFCKRLVAEADAAMYACKQNGRNQIAVRCLDSEIRNPNQVLESADVREAVT